MNSKSWKFFIGGSISIVLLLLVFTLYKIYNVEKKIFNTNKFVFELLAEKRVADISNVDNTDIIIGDTLAPVTMIVYTKYKCPYCDEFFNTTYLRIKKKYVDNGMLKIVIRYLVSPKNDIGYLVAKSSYYAYRYGIFQEFNSYLLNSRVDVLNKESISGFFVKNESISDDFKEVIGNTEISLIINRKVIEAANAGIFRTPSFIVNGQIYVGDKKDKFDEIIVNALSLSSCL